MPQILTMEILTMEDGGAPKRDIMGFVLILVGALLLMRNLGAAVGIGELWPLFMILFGIAFWAMFLSDRSLHALLMPASILFVTGIVFELCTLLGWSLMSTLWPFLIVAPGIGFLSMYLFGPGGHAFLLPGCGLVALGVLTLFRQSPWWRYWPVILIISGVSLIVRELRRRHS
jgi:hypothetical protein